METDLTLNTLIISNPGPKSLRKFIEVTLPDQSLDPTFPQDLKVCLFPPNNKCPLNVFFNVFNLSFPDGNQCFVFMAVHVLGLVKS